MITYALLTNIDEAMMVSRRTEGMAVYDRDSRHNSWPVMPLTDILYGRKDFYETDRLDLVSHLAPLDTYGIYHLGPQFLTNTSKSQNFIW